MADLGPSKKRIAQLLRMLSSSGGERRNAFAALERTMESENITWTDVGNAIEHGGDDSKYSEAEMQEFAQAARAEGVEAGIKIGQTRAGGGSHNGHGYLTLPKPVEMAEFCQQRPNLLKDDAQREFIDEMYVKTRRGISLKLGTLGYLASIYIKLGGRTG